MQSKEVFAKLIQHDNLSPSSDSSTVINKIPSDAKNLYISLPDETSTSALEKSLESERFEVILVEPPVSMDYFDAQRLRFKQEKHKHTQF